MILTTLIAVSSGRCSRIAVEPRRNSPSLSGCHSQRVGADYSGYVTRDISLGRLRFWTGRSWAWIKCRIQGRVIPNGWDVESPTLVQDGQQWKLHTANAFCAKPEDTSAPQPPPDASDIICPPRFLLLAPCRHPATSDMGRLLSPKATCG